MKVLVIDDEPLVRRSLGRALSANGYQVFEASDGLEGVEMWKKEKPDVVFLDVLMPKLSGPQVLQELGDQRSGKVIMMSAYSGQDNFETVKEAKVDHFISKPFKDIFEVVRLIDEV